MKRDPYKILLRTALILAVVVVVGIGVFYLCSVSVTKDYYAKKQEIEEQNAQAEVEFNSRMNELRTNANAFTDPITGDVSTESLPYWERTLDAKTWRVEDEGKTGLENTSTISMERGDLLLGGLLLVNPWHALPADYNYASLVSVGSTSGYQIQVTDSNVRLFPAAYEALFAAITEAKAGGLDYYLVREGYRTNEEQTTMFQNAMEGLSSKYSGDILLAEAKKQVNYPGTSEYQTGFAFRMDLYSKDGAQAYGNKKFQESDQGQWLSENGWKYGLIFRFPVDGFPNENWESKTYKTGISSRMNVYRYVGTAHSAAMRVLDMCLEEYVEFLIDHPHITVYEDGALKYEILRIGGADELTSFTLPVPNPASGYQASLDNMDGVVMAYTYQ
ncbi:MAG: M15 family metallopeptidase [Eubacteriales bacterium]|nr:M15 family metallopeptidase [Eubacteriales bacterium]